MSLRSFEALWPEQPALQLRKILERRQRRLTRSYRRAQRRVIDVISRQYYLTDALADSRQALHQNEDIALASLIILAVISFGSTSILSNIVYDFMLAASALSTALSTNLIILVALASGAVTVSLTWLMSFLQNSLSIALMDGANRKQKRSLRLTLRKSLRFSSRTAMAWGGLLIAALAPVSAFGLIAPSYIFCILNWLPA